MQKKIRHVLHTLALIALAGGSVFSVDPLAATEGAWQQSYKVRARLIAGGLDGEDAKTRLAFVQLQLEPGWKTYWRHPGEAGGIPPEFSWQGSSNLSAADVLYPAPQRMSEDLGDTIGYKDGVIFPLRLTPENTAEPIDLRVGLRFGICKDICVPSEAKFNAIVAARASQSLPSQFTSALDSVPREGGSLRPQDPMLQTVNAPKKTGEMWRIVFTTKHQSGATDADLFLEAPAGKFVPVPKRMREVTDPVRRAFEITLSEDEYQALKGKPMKATVVDGLGASQSQFVLR